MAFSGLSKKFTEFESTTSASDSDVILKSDSSGLVKKVSISSLANILKSKIIGTTSMGTTATTVTGAIAELKGLIGTGGGSGSNQNLGTSYQLSRRAASVSAPAGTYTKVSNTITLPEGTYMMFSGTSFIQQSFNANFILRREVPDSFIDDSTNLKAGENLLFSNKNMYMCGVFTVISEQNEVSIFCENNFSNAQDINFSLSSDGRFFSWKIIRLK